MLESPFAFFRGGASLMAADLAAGPRTGLYAQLCGDAHLSNFGVFVSPDRRLVFSINDFDETLPGPFEWDVKRLVASLAVAGREFGHDEVARRAMVTGTVREYRQAMANFATMRMVDVWYMRLDVANIIGRFSSSVSPKKAKRLQSEIAPTERRTASVPSRSCAPPSTVSSAWWVTRRSSPPSRAFWQTWKRSISKTPSSG